MVYHLHLKYTETTGTSAASGIYFKVTVTPSPDDCSSRYSYCSRSFNNRHNNSNNNNITTTAHPTTKYVLTFPPCRSRHRDRCHPPSPASPQPTREKARPRERPNRSFFVTMRLRLAKYSQKRKNAINTMNTNATVNNKQQTWESTTTTKTIMITTTPTCRSTVGKHADTSTRTQTRQHAACLEWLTVTLAVGSSTSTRDFLSRMLSMSISWNSLQRFYQQWYHKSVETFTLWYTCVLDNKSDTPHPDIHPSGTPSVRADS